MIVLGSFALRLVLAAGPSPDEAAPEEALNAEASPADAPSAEASPGEGAPDPEAAPELQRPAPDSVPGPEPAPTPAPAPTPTPVPEPEPEPAAGPATEPDPLEGAGDGYDPMVDSPEALRARSWRRSGIVATSVGGVLGVVALVFATSDPCARWAGNSCFDDARNRAALAVGLPGAVLLAGGVAMVAVGEVRLRRLRASLSPGPARAGASLAVRVRF
jgi:hypothetical protein